MTSNPTLNKILEHHLQNEEYKRKTYIEVTNIKSQKEQLSKQNFGKERQRESELI